MDIENIAKGKVTEYTGLNAFAAYNTVETGLALAKRAALGDRWMSSLGGLDFMNNKNPYTSISRSSKSKLDQYQTSGGVVTKVTGFEPDTANLDFYVVVDEQKKLGLYQSLLGLQQRAEALRWLCANSAISYDLGFWVISSINYNADTLAENGLEYEQKLTMSMIKTIEPKTEATGAGVISAIF